MVGRIRPWLLLCWCIAAATVAGCTQPVMPSSVVVRRVVDGDTIEVDTGQLVRYIGIDAPETRRREGGRWVFAPEPWGAAAVARNTALVSKRRVRLEYDVQTHDRHGRLLAYVWVGDVLVNRALVEEGLARLLTVPPNVRHVEVLRAAQTDARLAQRGVWSDAPHAR